MNEDTLSLRILSWIMEKCLPWLLISWFIGGSLTLLYFTYDKFFPGTQYLKLEESKWECSSGFEYHSDGVLTRFGRIGEGMQFVCTEYKRKK